MKGTNLLQKASSVMTLLRLTTQSITFTNGFGREVKISNRDWRDMGSPRTVTVTVEPGDLLNTAEAQS